MSTSLSASSIVIPPVKQPIPPAYAGLPDSATFARLASRPDRIEPDAAAFFADWLIGTGTGIRASDGRLAPGPDFRPIGSSLLFGPAPLTAQRAAATAAASGSAVTAPKKPAT
jgi:hypothetical protein